MKEKISNKLNEMKKLNDNVNLISINARIEASKALHKEDGRRFAIIAQEMKKIAISYDTSLKELKKELEGLN